MLKQCVEQIEQALARIDFDPDGVMVLIDDGECVAAHFSGTDESGDAMARCMISKFPSATQKRPPCCNAR